MPEVVYVICCNDSLEAAVLNKDRVPDVLERLAQADHKRNTAYGSRITYEYYRKKYYWHYHTVSVMKGG